MNIAWRYVTVSFFSFLIFSQSRLVLADDWKEIKGTHFIVRYDRGVSFGLAKKVLRSAEYYYGRIGEGIGYARYSNFWTWDERVHIIIYKDQQTFVDATGQPDWSKGMVDRDKLLSDSRMIVTYPQETSLEKSVLPHEISHLILRDFLGQKKIPIWFDEGVAQLYEDQKRMLADRLVRSLMRAKQYIAFRQLFTTDIRGEQDPVKVQIFYAQSVSIIDFLISQYGSDAFGRLCQRIREGDSFESALRTAYSNQLNSIQELEEKWVKHIIEKDSGG
jgi:hypothetical protein